MLESLSDLIGMLGVILILIAYLLLSIGRCSAYTVSYQLVNLIGALLILFSLYFHWNLSSVVIEIAWAIISIIGLCRVFINKKKH